MEELVIFSRTYDLLRWLLPRCKDFPKVQRFVLTKRLQDAVLDFQESIVMANAHRGQARLDDLHSADGHLHKVRLYLRIAREEGWFSAGQYAHVSRMVQEIGALLGGWIKQTSRSFARNR